MKSVANTSTTPMTPWGNGELLLDDDLEPLLLELPLELPLLPPLLEFELLLVARLPKTRRCWTSKYALS